MFRSYFEGLKDPSARALPAPTVHDGSIGARIAKTEKPDNVSRKYDALFAKHAGILPVPFLRALGKRESNLNPRDIGGSFWGILQVGWRGKHSVLKGYNERFNTSFVKDDLLDPYTNIMIASELINRIARAYMNLSRENPTLMKNMVPDFENKEFVKLLLAGWNSGYSRAGGVQRVARYLANRGVPVTHDAVFANAAKAGATKFLHASVPGKAGAHARLKQRWQRGVASLYFRMNDYTSKPPGGGLLIVREDGRDDSGSLPSGSSASIALAAPLLLGLGIAAILAAK